MRGKQILAVVASVAVLGALAAAPALARDGADLDEAVVDAVQTGSVIVDPPQPEDLAGDPSETVAPGGADVNLERVAETIARDWETWNPGGAPVSPDFALAALRQGLTRGDITRILESEALGGAITSPTGSSSERLDYFTQNPSRIPSLLEAVRSVEGAPTSYAEYLAAGGEPGAGYRSYGQLLGEAVLAIPGVREVHLDAVGKVEVPGFGIYDPDSPTYRSLVRAGYADPDVQP